MHFWFLTLRQKSQVAIQRFLVFSSETYDSNPYKNRDIKINGQIMQFSIAIRVIMGREQDFHHKGFFFMELQASNHGKHYSWRRIQKVGRSRYWQFFLTNCKTSVLLFFQYNACVWGFSSCLYTDTKMSYISLQTLSIKHFYSWAC